MLLKNSDPKGGKVLKTYSLSFRSDEGHICTEAQRALVRSAWERGRRAAMTPELEACMRERMTYRYRPYPGDPFEHEPRATQLARAIDASRTQNAALVGCNNDIPAAIGWTLLGSYGHSGDEAMTLNSSYLDHLLAGPLEMAEVEIVHVLWHEALHTQGYAHGASTSPDYPFSAPEIAAFCMGVASLANGVTWYSNGVARRVGPGLYERGDGLDDLVSWMVIPPAIGVATCPSCYDRTTSGMTIAYLTPTPPVGTLRVVPRVEVFDLPQYGGRSSSLTVGIHPASRLASTIGDDAIRSMLVPAGVMVYACSEDRGGRGAGVCRLFDSPAADTTSMGGISYLEILPRVTTFTEPGFYGQRVSYGLGAHTAWLRSIIVVPGQTAVACTAPPGTAGRFCRTFRRSATDVGPELTGRVVYLEISSDVPPATFHVSAVATGGSISSQPWGISCGDACSASFPAGSSLTLVATPFDPATSPRWQGCDSVVAGNCVVAVNRDREVRANFVYCSQEAVTECENGCYDSCAGRVTCVKRCVAACASQCP